MLLSFMDEIETEEARAPRLDDIVAEFLGQLPAGDGTASCRFLWYAFALRHPEVSEMSFEESCRRLGKTTDLYGRGIVTGVDEKATRQWFIEFVDRS